MENKKKVGAVFIIVGRQGTGKSPTIKAIREKREMRNNIVFDRRNEYSDDDWTRFTSMERFRKKWGTFTDSFIVIEEATGFLSSFKEMELADILTGIQHNRNILVLVFHSLMDTPKYIYRLANFMYLFPTNDNEKDIRTSRGELIDYYLNCGQKRGGDGPDKDWFEPEIIDITEI